MPPVIVWPHHGPHERTALHAYEWDDNGFNRRGWFIQSVIENDSVILWDEQLTEYRMSRLAFEASARRYREPEEGAFERAMRRTFTDSIQRSMNRASFPSMNGLVFESFSNGTWGRR